MDNREGIKPESLTPPPPDSNGKVPAEALREGLPPPVPEINTDEAEQDAGFFSPTNLVILGLLIALLIYLVSKFNIEELWNIVKAALGLSFVIFIHELGHFLAAKWCDVNVTTFSIGFGPPIPGCWFRWGETTYKLAVLPLGGYVQMVGQIDGDEGADDDDDPRSYRKKSVGARMLIISAGVIMNAILAIICFIAVYMGPGREHPLAVVSHTDSAGPVFRNGVPTGARFEKIGAIDDPTFTDLKYTVIFSTAGEKIPIVYRLPGHEPVTIEIESRKDKNDKTRAIGVTSPGKLQFATMRDKEFPCIPGTPAEDAKFQSGDVIIGMSDPNDPTRVTDLPDDPRMPGTGRRDYFEFNRRLRLLADKEIILRVERGKGESKPVVDVKVAPTFKIDFGVRMQMGPVLAIRAGSPAQNEVRPPNPTDKLEGDLIEAVSVTEADAKETVFKDNALDPERLPQQLRAWSERLDKAGLDKDRFVTLTLRRHQEQGGQQFVTVKAKLKWDKAWQNDRVAPLSGNAPMPIPELGLAYQIKAVVVGVTREDSPFKKGDVIKNLKIDAQGFKEVDEGVWRKKDIEEGQWAFFSFDFATSPRNIKKLMVKVERADDKGEKKIVELEVPLHHDKTSPIEDRGWLLTADTRKVKASTPWQAVEMGLTDTHHRMMEVFFTLRGIIMGDISVDVMGGPLTIARGAYMFAGLNFGEFIFFMGLISINLAVVNFLPIPVLDGGHMVFLIYEKLRGKPASEAVRIWATYAGLAVILCLMMFVLYLDVNRLFF